MSSSEKCPKCGFDDSADATCEWHSPHEVDGMFCWHRQQLAAANARIAELEARLAEQNQAESEAATVGYMLASSKDADRIRKLEAEVERLNTSVEAYRKQRTPSCLGCNHYQIDCIQGELCSCANYKRVVERRNPRRG